MWHRSWLSREVLAFSVYAGLVSAAVLLDWLRPAASIAGFIGIFCSARIYMAPARPSWNSWRTLAAFLLTALVLSGHPMLMPGAAIAQALLEIWKLVSAKRSPELELRQSARLLAHDFRAIFALRLALLLALTVTPVPVAFGLAFASEVIGRYLFFVTVVPRNMAATFFGTAREAA
jgi:DMSO reductase anchor subunit